MVECIGYVTLYGLSVRDFLSRCPSKETSMYLLSIFVNEHSHVSMDLLLG